MLLGSLPLLAACRRCCCRVLRLPCKCPLLLVLEQLLLLLRLLLPVPLLLQQHLLLLCTACTAGCRELLGGPLGMHECLQDKTKPMRCSNALACSSAHQTLQDGFTHL
jgi:hypothetical protein